jgi:hypothetical protein
MNPCLPPRAARTRRHPYRLAAAARAAAPVLRARAAVEGFEPRVLLAFAPIGPEFAANTTAAGDQSNPVIACDADGDFVIVWGSAPGQDGSGSGIFARRYSAAGVAQGGEFRVNTTTAGNQATPAVAMDADGDFVVAWDGPDGSLDGVFAQRFAANGTPVGNEFRVNVTTDQGQTAASVAMDADGNFVVAWIDDNQGAAVSHDVHARLFSAGGQPRGGEFRVNTLVAGRQTKPAVAMSAAGDFAVAWESGGQDGEGYGIYAKRFTAAGAEVTPPAGVPRGEGNEFRVNTVTAQDQLTPSLAMDMDGDLVVAWWTYGANFDAEIAAQRFSRVGAAAGGETRVNSQSAGFQYQPSVAADADGDFLVTWTSSGQDGSYYGNYAKRFTAAGAELPPPAGAPAGEGNEFRINTFTTSDQQQPAAALDADGDAVIAWMSRGQDAAGSAGVYAQRYDESTDTAAPFMTGLRAGVTDLPPGGRVIYPTSRLNLLFSQELSSAGVNSANIRSNYALTRNGADASALIDGAAFALNLATRKYEATLTLTGPLPDGQYLLSPRANLRDTAGNLLDGDRNGAPGGAVVGRTFTVSSVVPVGNEAPVNSTLLSQQDGAVVAADADGDFVVAWQSSGQDAPGGRGIYARQFNAAGVPQTGEIPVNQFTAGGQSNPAVAMDGDGDFVVVWQSSAQDGDGYGIYARLYAANGQPRGNELRVNETVAGGQILPSVAMDADGDFVVAWQGPGTAGSDIFFRRYNASGVAQSAQEVRANVVSSGNDQTSAAVASDGAGNFVLTWTSDDGAAAGGLNIYARRYGADGVARGNDLRVNLAVTGDQQSPTVGMDADGDFVVAWRTAGETVSSPNDLHFRRFNAAGQSPGADMLVNGAAAVRRVSPSVAVDADGDFVVTWLSYGSSRIVARRFDAAGVASGDEFPVQTTPFSSGFLGRFRAAADADGDFVVAVHAGSGTPNAADVFVRRFGPNTPPVSLGIAAVNVQQDERDTLVALWDAFEDPNSPDNTLTYSVVSVTSPALFTRTLLNPGNGVLTLDYAPGQSGRSTVTVRATDPSGLSTDISFEVNVTPTRPFGLTARVFVFDPPPHRVRVTFNRDIDPATLSADDLTFVAVGPQDPPEFVASAVTYDPNTRTATFTLPPAGESFLANGNYRATLPAGAVTDAAGTALAAAWITDFFVLAGDVNRDRAVNGTDFAILAGNFGKSGMTYAQGDLNGDGSVNGSDFALLAGNFGRAVPPPAAAAVAVAPGRAAATAAPAPPVRAAKTPQRRAAPARRARPAAPAERDASRRTAP